MSFIRIKAIPGKNGQSYCYAYLVRNIWNSEKQQPQQKVIAYLGKAKGLERFNVKEVFERDGFQCRSLDCYRQSDLTIDHKVPLSKGGTNDLANLQTLCSKCNHKKGTSTIWETKQAPE